LAGSGAYPELYALVGGNVPDYRGLFLRGHGSQAHTQNNGSTIGVTSTTHSSGSLGSVQGDATRNVTFEVVQNTSFWPIIMGIQNGALYTEVMNYRNDIQSGSGSGYGNGVYNIMFDSSRVVPVTNEIRPVNTAVRYLIRALP
jgi:hypothetical protein